LIRKLKNSNLSIEDLAIAGKALTAYRVFEDTRSAIFKAEPCDPNILGFTSDLALQVNDIDACVVFCGANGGVKISVRSCVRETMANELAARLCEAVGSGGGRKDKAGGCISGDKLAELGVSPEEFLTERMARYYGEYDLIYSGDPQPCLGAFARYRKKTVPIGYARSADVFPAGTDIVVRTLEGDTFITSGRDTYIMVGICQEIWPIKREKFEASYRVSNGPYDPDERFWGESHYAPTIVNHVQGEPVSLLPYIRPCVPTGESVIHARKLPRRTKVFTAWNQDGYMFGGAGDYLALSKREKHRTVYFTRFQLAGRIAGGYIRPAYAKRSKRLEQ
jgi:phosphoglycolate phosphatase